MNAQICRYILVEWMGQCNTAWHCTCSNVTTFQRLERKTLLWPQASVNPETVVKKIEFSVTRKDGITSSRMRINAAKRRRAKPSSSEVGCTGTTSLTLTLQQMRFKTTPIPTELLKTPITNRSLSFPQPQGSSVCKWDQKSLVAQRPDAALRLPIRAYPSVFVVMTSSLFLSVPRTTHKFLQTSQHDLCLKFVWTQMSGTWHIWWAVCSAKYAHKCFVQKSILAFPSDWLESDSPRYT